MDLERSPLALPFPAIPPIDGVTLRVARARYKEWDRCDLTYAELAEGTTVAGVFTKNVCCSSEVELGREQARLGSARGLVVNAGQFQRLHRLSRARGGRADHGPGGGASRLRAERGVRLLDRGDRRAAAQGQGARRRCRGARGSCRARGKKRPQPSEPPTLSRKGAVATAVDRRAHGDDRRDHQGLGHDRARHGDNARLRVHRRGGLAGLPAGLPEPRQPEHVLVHHRRFRHLDQRHGARLRHRQGRQRPARLVRRCRRRCLRQPRCTTSAGSWRCSWCATAKARRN